MSSRFRRYVRGVFPLVPLHLAEGIPIRVYVIILVAYYWPEREVFGFDITMYTLLPYLDFILDAAVRMIRMIDNANLEWLMCVGFVFGSFVV